MPMLAPPSVRSENAGDSTLDEKIDGWRASVVTPPMARSVSTVAATDRTTPARCLSSKSDRRHAPLDTVIDGEGKGKAGWVTCRS